jgi:hypothetical protein
MSSEIYFGLWAEDIGKYLSAGYNTSSVSELRKALLTYVSVDTDNPEEVDTSSLVQLLGMTGLSLDYRSSQFPYRDEVDEEPTDLRIGKKVNKAFIS